MCMETLQRSEHRMTWKSAPSLCMAGLGEQGVPQEAGACAWALLPHLRMGAADAQSERCAVFFVESKYEWAMLL